MANPENDTDSEIEVKPELKAEYDKIRERIKPQLEEAYEFLEAEQPFVEAYARKYRNFHMSPDIADVKLWLEAHMVLMEYVN